MSNGDAEGERLVRCFDPDAALVEGRAEYLVISPRWGRLRRRPPLLASALLSDGAAAAWQTARANLLAAKDLEIRRALATYGYRVRMRAGVAREMLLDSTFDLHRHCHALLDRCGAEKCAVTLRREAFWIRSLPPAPDGRLQFEFGNLFLVPISAAAVAAEAKTLW